MRPVFIKPASAHFLSYPVGYLVDGSACDACELSAAVVLVVDVVGDVLEVLEVRPDEHVAQWDEVAVLEVLDLKQTNTSTLEQVDKLVSNCPINVCLLSIRKFRSDVK